METTLTVEKPFGCLRFGGLAAILASMLGVGGIVFDAGGGDSFWLVVMAVVAAAGFPLGVAFGLGRSGVTIERTRGSGVVVQWKRLFVTFGETSTPLHGFRTVGLLREKPARKREVPALYHVRLVGDEESLELLLTVNHVAARRLALDVAEFTGLELVERALSTE